jgi:mono/diheme cytochrome c family protein
MRTLIGAVLGGAAVTFGVGCGVDDNKRDLVAGKQQFAEKCAACHKLARAEATGTSGPDLDQAFERALKDGMGRSGIEGAVRDQILHPARLDPKSPVYMPPDLVKGDDVDNVAAYVAQTVAAGGEDQGLLATAVKKPGSGKPVAAENGVLDLPVGAGLAYEANAATAEAGPLELTSLNNQPTPHNIALEGEGISDAIGEVVGMDGVSSIKVDVKPGEYVFYCSVEGHREGGMEGTLTVK